MGSRISLRRDDYQLSRERLGDNDEDSGARCIASVRIPPVGRGGEGGMDGVKISISQNIESILNGTDLEGLVQMVALVIYPH